LAAAAAWYHCRGRRRDAADAVRGAGRARGNAAAVASDRIPLVQRCATFNSGGEGADQKPAHRSCNGIAHTHSSLGKCLQSVAPLGRALGSLTCNPAVDERVSTQQEDICLLMT